MDKDLEISSIEGKQLYDFIYNIRGTRVMLDFDLAKIYGYTTKAFNRQVKNNIEKFEQDFMFQLTDEECEILRCKNCTSNWGGRRYNPYAFTEQGIYMLMTVLKGALATKQTSGGIFHDRYIVVDYKTTNEQIFHCGASSKDGGNKVTTISLVSDNEIYHQLIDQLMHNPELILH